ncbi:MAG: phosphoserine phosphatase [Myxococcota bacterium]|jgi:phosphoserine phosphatase
MHVYRWDLDKTYLDTDIHSVRAMIRAAFEPASEKRNIPGAGALVRGLMRSDPSCRVGIVSGSPVQLRAVLEEKLALDGVRFDSLVLKDHIGNLKRGRLRAVYGQLGYKLPALLEQRRGLGSAVRETCFGDDTEVDAVVYALYGEVVAGRVSESTMARIMTAGGAYPDAIDLAKAALRHVGTADIVDDIFIHIDRGIPIRQFQLLGPRVIPVFSWFQAALILHTRGRLDIEGIVEVVSNTAADSPDRTAAWIQDVVRRGLLDRDEVLAILAKHSALEPLVATSTRALDRLRGVTTQRTPRAPDFLGYLTALRH